jgi:hypothetical protein
MLRIAVTMILVSKLFLDLADFNQGAFGGGAPVSPAVAEKAALDAEKLHRELHIRNRLLPPGGYQGVDSKSRAAMKGIESDNRSIQNNLRSLNNSIRDMNTKINRINTLNRRRF